MREIRMKKFFRILYIFIFLILVILLCFKPFGVETNILNAIVPAQNKSLIDLSGKYSSKFNVLVESENPESVYEYSDLFDNQLDKSMLKTSIIDVNKVLEVYKTHRGGLLSNNYEKLLENGKFDEVKNQSLQMLYNPLGVSVLSPQEDPFFLLTDFLQNLGGTSDILTFDDKYYKILSYEFDGNIAFSPSFLNKKVKKIVQLQQKLSNDDVKIYLTGASIHSYFASSRSIIEINIIGIFSILFVIGLCIYYFRTVKILLPLTLSLFIGCLNGYMLTGLVFGSVHILTFVFSMTLIGISADYSLHYFVSKTSDKTDEQTIKEIFKSLTSSMITTCMAFLILMFSGTLLLKQIALFTIAGLLSVYLFVILFYPVICKDIDFPEKCIWFWNFQGKKYFIWSILILSLIGLCRVNYNDDIRGMYEPSKDLVKAEKLFAQVSGVKSKTSFLLVEGKNLQECLEKEEKIIKTLNGVEYQALSRYIPSIKKQHQNKKLIKALYLNGLPDYASGANPPVTAELTFDEKEFPFLNNFMFDKNKTLVMLYDFDSPELLKDFEGVKYYNVKEDISDIVKTCRENCSKLFVPVFALLFLILASVYGIKNAGRIILPSLLASAFVIGLLGILGTEVNLFHILAIFLLIGFSLDYSIFRFNGAKHVNDAVFMSCMTSVFSFMMLSFTCFKLISSLGFVLSVGLLTSYILSVFLISKN